MARASTNGSRATGPVRVSKVAYAVADRIRAWILAGDVGDGERLPAVGDLAEQLAVSVAAIREGLRILESEGLVSIRRGQHGGAVCHRPTAKTAAYTVALALSSTGTTLGDVFRAQAEVEARCAAMCATRPDRASTVVPRLRQLNVEAHELVGGDMAALVRSTKAFHDMLVEGCGNATLTLFAGIVESICFAETLVWGEQSAIDDVEFVREGSVRALEFHESICDLVDAGDAVQVAEVVAEHHRRQWSYSERFDQPVDASLVRLGW